MVDNQLIVGCLWEPTRASSSPGAILGSGWQSAYQLDWECTKALTSCGILLGLKLALLESLLAADRLVAGITQDQLIGSWGLHQGQLEALGWSILLHSI